MSLEEIYEDYEKGTAFFTQKSSKERDDLVSPSVYNRRMPREVHTQTHIDLMKKRSEEFLKKGHNLEEVRYGERCIEVYDVIRPSYVTDDTPVLVLFHGGYWMCNGKFTWHAPSEPLLPEGIISVCVGYSHTPHVTMTEIMDQAIKVLHHIFNVTFKNSKSFYMAGQCCGVVNAVWGCCYSSLNEDQLKSIKGFLLWSGVYDIRPLALTSENKIIHFSQKEITDLTLLSKQNINLLVDRFSHSRFLIMMGQLESPEFFRQKDAFTKVLRGHNIRVDDVVLEGTDHVEYVELMCQPDSEFTRKILEFMKI